MNRSALALGIPVATGIILFSAEDARADVSSWFYLGGGATQLEQQAVPNLRPFTLQTDLGLGSPPDKAVIIGGVLKSFMYFGEGIDLALAVRGASGGFVRGGFGFAIDAGFYERWWGQNSAGFLGAIALGGPFGLQLSGMTELGSNDVRSYSLTMGIDFLRLTVYRTTSQNYWPNPILPPGVGSTR